MAFAIWIAAALSGAAALAYEVCWSRALVVPLGNSSDAAAMVFAGFMLGIAGGARAFGGLSERSSRPLRLYAVLEIALGLFAVVAPSLFVKLSAIPSVPLRFSVALLLVSLPCFVMGASLPLLVRVLTDKDGSVGREIAIAYGVNTAGAALGALSTGFFGVARIGVSRSSSWAAAASVTAGLIALAVRAPPRSSVEERSDAKGRPAALFAAFVSGFAMLGCELLWGRVLTFVFGHDAYAFATLLVVVLVGLSVGGLLYRPLSKRDPETTVLVLLALFAIAILASYWGASALVVRRGRDPFGIAASSDLAVSVWIELLRALAYTPVLVLLPATLSGMLLPAACALYAGSAKDAGRRVGVVFLANGIGSALGAVVAALVFVQTLGIQGAFVLLAVLSAASAFVLRRSIAGALPVVAVGVLAFVMPRELPKKMLLQAFGDRHQQLLHYEEGRTGTVSVIHNDINGEKELLMNGLNEVTTRLVHDQSFKLLGHLGPLLHPNPKRAMMICLGAGLSAGATLRHPLESLDVVDLSAIVAHGARKFAVENNGVLDDPRLHLHIADGRQFLLNSPGGYDVAVIDSTHPKSVDSWILYTKEFYDLVHARLADGGIVVQWLPLHGLSEREFKIVVRTFLQAFPDMTLWANAGFETYGPVAYAKLVGTKGKPLAIDRALLARKLADPRIHADLAPFGMASEAELLNLFIARAPAIRAWTEGLPAQTDDHPMVPYTTTWSKGRRMEPPLLLALRSPAVVAPDLEGAFEAQGLVLAGLLDRAAELHPESETVRLFVAQSKTTLPYYQSLAARYSDDPEKLFEAANQLGALGSPQEALAVYERALSLRPRDFRLRLNLALLEQQIGDFPKALKLLSNLRDEEPTSPVVLYNLGAALLASGDAAAARVQLELALGWDPSHGRARLALAVALLQLGELDRADAALREVLRENPFVAEAHDLSGLVFARRGDFESAIEHHRRAIALQPYRAVSHFNLAVALQAKSLDEAEAEYRAAIRIEPRYAAALNNLGLLRSAHGKHDEAAELFLQTLDVDPHHAMAAHNLGVARRAQGLTVEAKSAFCLAVSLGLDSDRDACAK